MKNTKSIDLDEKVVFNISRLGVKTIKNKNIAIGILIIMLAAIFLLSFTLGRYAIPLPELLNILIGKFLNLPATWPKSEEMVLFQVRIPRIFAALLIGTALSASGAAYQGLFKNPMVSPDILGASSGAGVGAVIAILLSFGSVGMQLMAFIMGLIAVALTYIISSIIGRHRSSIVLLVLIGMVVSNIFSAIISITKYLADPDNKLPTITFWLMGGLSVIDGSDILMFLIPFTLGIVPLILIRWKINILSFGDEEAKTLGVDTRRMRLIIIICSTMLTAAAVSISGMISWIGLIIPHIARIIVGPNYKILLPVSMIIGGGFLLLVDDFARNMFTLEVPLGILTSIIGAPLFLYLLLKSKKSWA
ncbi:FecCD family ABC transporter permease [Clostridium arbusti]|uniref:FecCD family ABC transporter permease n=1 Tax=Clostridium arbusti TaxID=1137848 RepID=UPI00028A051A|nr:iron ABC transporter permease [Clostridium arbusti]